VLVYPGPARNLIARAGEFSGSKGLPKNFTFLLDPDYKVTNLYGLRWNAPRETAYPSTFVLDRQRTVHFVRISKTHGGRPRTAEVVAAVSKLK